VWEVRRYAFGGSLFVLIVLLVWSARVVELGVVSVGGFMVWATCRLCCVFALHLPNCALKRVYAFVVSIRSLVAH
jgi:hypothetical protein